MSEQPRRTPQWLVRCGRRTSVFRAEVRGTRVGRIVWRAVITVVGTVVVVVGIVLLPLPGPGWLVIFAGLGLLATEYDWARRLLTWTRRKATALTAKARRRIGSKPR